MPGGGTFVLCAAAEDLPAEQARHLGVASGSYLRLWVADTGTGMDAATLARATEPFFTSKPKGRGTGLGLSMADGFAIQSGGALRIKSVLGKGTTVTLWLPRAEAVGAAAEQALRTGGKPPRRRALVVDDAAIMRRFLHDCLDHAGWDTEEASGTEEALALLRTDGIFDALITDLVMPPGPDGMVLIREARTRYPGLPTILISGADLLSGLDPAERQDIPALFKPVSSVELVDCLSAVARKDEP
jgi:CheY-like chemotaxis protein